MSNIPEDLRWAAENIKDWPFGVTFYFGVSKPEWQAARQQLEQERNSEGEGVSDEKWSAWIDNEGNIPIKFLGKVVSVKYRDGVINDGVIAGASFDDSGSCPERNAGDWKIDNIPGDIIAYRYRLDDNAQTPEENRMDIIGQNGNDGEHYDVVMTEEEEELPTQEWTGSSSDSNEEGRKYDTDKPAMDLIPPYMEEEVGMVLAFGAQKYAPGNWRKVKPLRSRYLAAAQRHINALKKGEQMDPESGLHHAAHAVCCLMFLGEVELEGEV